MTATLTTTGTAGLPYRYRLTNRPATIGTYPDVDGDGNRLDLSIVEQHWPPAIGPDGRNWYATVAYAERLDFYRIWRYDMVPEDKVEAAKFLFWLESDRNDEWAERRIAKWCAEDRHLLASLRLRGDALAEAVLIILEAQDE